MVVLAVELRDPAALVVKGEVPQEQEGHNDDSHIGQDVEEAEDRGTLDQVVEDHRQPHQQVDHPEDQPGERPVSVRSAQGRPYAHGEDRHEQQKERDGHVGGDNHDASPLMGENCTNIIIIKQNTKKVNRKFSISAQQSTTTMLRQINDMV